MFDPQHINFRLLTMADLPLMHEWLNSPQVARWYQPEPISYAEVEDEYGPTIRGETPGYSYLILHGATPIGYIQRYLLSDYPEHQQRMGVTEPAAGTDMFIGHPDYIHRSLGAPLLRQFLREIVFADPSILSCVLDPEPENKIAIRVYEKVGFQYLYTIPASDDTLTSYVMRVPRDAVLGE